MINTNNMSFDEFMSNVFSNGQTPQNNGGPKFEEIVADTIGDIETAKAKAQLGQLGHIIEGLTMITGIYATMLADQVDGQL